MMLLQTLFIYEQTSHKNCAICISRERAQGIRSTLLCTGEALKWKFHFGKSQMFSAYVALGETGERTIVGREVH
jgi:hypothetical protein